MKPNRAESGFSLIEVLVTMGFVAVSGLAIMTVINSGLQRNSSTEMRQKASDLAAIAAEGMRTAAPSTECREALTQGAVVTFPVTASAVSRTLASITTGAVAGPALLTDGQVADQNSGSLGIVTGGLTLDVDLAANSRIDTVSAADRRFLGTLSMRFANLNRQTRSGPAELERSLFLELSLNAADELVSCRFLGFKPNGIDSYFEGALGITNFAGCTGPANYVTIAAGPPTTVSCAALPASAP